MNKLNNREYRSTCYCSAIELELYLPNGLEDLRRCNCSICSRKGAIVGSCIIG